MNPSEFPLSDGPAILRDRRDGVTIPTIWVAFVLSLLLHIAALWQLLPNLRPPSPDGIKLGDARGSLIVRLAPAPSPQPSPKPPPPAPMREAHPPVAAPRQRPAPPEKAFNRPAAVIPAPPPVIASPPPAVPDIATPAPARPPAGSDLSSYIEAQRRAHAQQSAGAPAPAVVNAQPVENDKSRSERIVAANLGAQRAQTFGYDPKQGGGIFQITRMGYDTAEFAFFGWNKDIRRNTKQQIEVRKGDNSDIRIAVVRKMISIIREYEQGDFVWDSYRLGRSLTLSARARDNAGLEEFMLREMFDDVRVPR
jgi:hypothetical protein